MSYSSRLIVLLTFLLALMASIMPLPLTIDAFRPDWVLVVLLYWCLAIPTRVNVISAWVLGFILDVLLGSTLGIHAGAMAIVTYLVSGNYQKIRNFSVWQQALIVGMFSALYQLIVFWLQRILTDIIFLPSYLYPVITTIVLWPWVFLLLRQIRRRFQVK